MHELSKGAQAIAKSLGQTETERMLSAAMLRVILGDMTRIYFEYRKATNSKGVLVFNPEDPGASRFVTTNDIKDDIAVAEESCDTTLVQGFNKVLEFVDNHDNNEVAIVVLVNQEGFQIIELDPLEANKRIDDLTKSTEGGIILP